jgi:adhesin/invasin
MRLYVLLAAAVAVAACGKDSSTPTTPTTPTGTNGFSLVLDTGMVDSAKVAIGTVVPVRVKLTQNGSPAIGIQMNWTIGAGHGAVSAAATPTNSAGVATVNWTIGDTSGVNSLTAASSGASVTFTAIALPGSASQMLRVSADSSSVVAGASLPLTAKVVDRIGNGVPGATVTWTTTGGSLSATSTTSGANGNVTSNFTTAGVGTYTVTVTLPGKASVSFKVVAF